MNKEEALSYLKTINDAKIQNMRNLERKYQESGLMPFGQQDVNTNSEIRFTDDFVGDEDRMYRDEARTNLLKIMGKKNEERVLAITDTNVLNDAQIKELALYWEDYEQPLRKFEGKLLEFNRFKSILQDLLNAGIRKRQPIESQQQQQQPTLGRTDQQQIPETPAISKKLDPQNTPEVQYEDIYNFTSPTQIFDNETVADFKKKNPELFQDENLDNVIDNEIGSVNVKQGLDNSKLGQVTRYKLITEIRNLFFPDGTFDNSNNKYEVFKELKVKLIQLGLEGLNKKNASTEDLKSSINNLENNNADDKTIQNIHKYVISTPFQIDTKTNKIISYSLANFNRSERIKDITSRYDPKDRTEWNKFLKENIKTDGSEIAKVNYNLTNKFNKLTNDEIVLLYNNFVADPVNGKAVVGKGMKPHMKVIGSRYYIDSRKVGRGILEVRYLKNRHLTNLKTQSISDDMKPIVSDIIDGKGINKELYKKLDAKEKNLVGHLAKMAQSDEDLDTDEFTKEF